MSEERNYTLYKITAPDSEKFYIGVTGKTVEKRLVSHFTNAKYSKKKNKLFFWLRKHSATAEITTILDRLTKEVALELERITVDLCFKYEGALILNTAQGGGMPPSSKGIKRAESTRAKISAFRKGYRYSEEAKAKMSSDSKMMGRLPSAKATPASVAACSRTVVGINDEGVVVEFKSAANASRWLGMNKHRVSVAIYMCGKAGGYRWSYKK